MGRKKKTEPVELVIGPVPEAARRMFAKPRENDTPDNVLRNALREAYGVDVDDERAHNKFVSSLMANLSLLATGGRNDDTFEPDFDTFIMMVVRSVNGCGEMLALLREHGIEYRPSWLREDGEDEED